MGKGIPLLVIAAASLDDIVAISAFSMCIGLATRDSDSDSDSSLVWLIMNMPLTLLLGVGVGLVGGLLLSLIDLWDQQ